MSFVVGASINIRSDYDRGDIYLGTVTDIDDALEEVAYQVEGEKYERWGYFSQIIEVIG
jgi:hypothetical protein